MAVNDTEELSVTSTLAGQDLVNTYHFRCLTPDTFSPLTYEQVLIDAWQASCYTTYRAMTPTPVQIARISARQVCGSPPLRARIDESVGQAGSYFASGDVHAPWMAVLVREKTAFAGRSYQGRNFYHIGYEDDVTGVNVNAARRTAIDAYNTALMAAFGPSGTNPDFRLVVHSHKLASVPGTQCQNSSTQVINLSTSTYLTTMRSRRSRSGA
jgi:hypothetical protein